MDERQKRLLQRGREHYKAEEWDEAEQALAPLARARLPFADVYEMLGVISYHTGRRQEAAALLEEALRLNPAYTEAALNLAVTYNDLGRYDEARIVYQRMLAHRHPTGGGQIDPFVKGKLANMHADVAAAYEQAGLPLEAAHELERALALCPDFIDLRTRLGACLRAAGDLEGSARELGRVVDEHPTLPGPRLQLGLTHHAAGKLADAAHEWREAQALDPDNKFARLYLRLIDEGAAR